MPRRRLLVLFIALLTALVWASQPATAHSPARHHAPRHRVRCRWVRHGHRRIRRCVTLHPRRRHPARHPAARPAPAKPSAAPAAAPAPAPAPAPPAPAGGTPLPVGPYYLNPVFAQPFPDPMVLDVGDRHDEYYAYATGDLFPILRSTDLVNWTAVGTAFAQRPAWVQQSGDWHPWAPSVLEVQSACPGAPAGSDGPCFLMYYVGQHATLQPAMNCIGIAAASDPGGPFTDLGILQAAAGVPDDGSGRPIGCGDASGYSNIDPAPFVDQDGNAYLYVSTGAACDPTNPTAPCPWQPTISVIPLTSDLLQAAGPRVPLFSGDPGSWEQAPWSPVVEGPWMVRRGSTYVLFYSGGDWTGRYGMGYATSSSPTGPFTKAPENPILTDSSSVFSAGGGSLVTGPAGGDWVAYHGRAGDMSLPRELRIDPLHWDAQGRPSVAGPTDTPQTTLP